MSGNDREPGEDLREVIRLRAGTEIFEVPMEELTQIVMKPEVIRVPAAPERVAGMIHYQGTLTPLFYAEGAEMSGEPACAVFLRDHDGGLYGLLADEIIGSGDCDTVSEEGI